MKGKWTKAKQAKLERIIIAIEVLQHQIADDHNSLSKAKSELIDLLNRIQHGE